MGLPTDFSCYVYLHKDPTTQKVVYVGKGSGQRAWMIRNSNRDAARYGHRSKQHYEWAKKLDSMGIHLGQVVLIVAYPLTDENARALEKELIKKYNPIFNKHKGHQSMVDKELINKAKNLRKDGMFYSQIAKELGVKSAMTAWRYANG